MNKTFYLRRYTRGKKYMKRCLASLTIRKIQIKTTLHITEWLSIKKLKIPRAKAKRWAAFIL